jgi:hypothetical protein
MPADSQFRGLRIGGLRSAHDDSVFVDPHARRHIGQVVEDADEMGLVDDLRVGGFGFVVELTCRFFAAAVLGEEKKFKILIFQVFVDGLPPGQVEAAPSPGGPGVNEDVLSSKIAEVHEVPVAILELKVWCDRRGQQRRLPELHRRETPDVVGGVVGVGLVQFSGESGDVKPFLTEARHELAAVFVLNDGNTDFVETGAFGLEDESVDAREIFGRHPEIRRGGQRFFQSDGFALVKDRSGFGRCCC